jgi:predicted dehydrogenase
MADRIGIIGAGRIAREHARAICAVGCRVAAVCDVNRDAAVKLAAETSTITDAKAHAVAGASCGVTATDSLDEMLALEDVPAVVVAVPNAIHRDVAVAALRTGKDVLLEKPMAMSLAECDEIIRAAAEMQRILQMGFVCRYAPRVAAVRELIARGELGTIYHAKATMIRKRGIPGLGRWFTTRDQSGGGVLIDIGVHLIDLVIDLVEPQTRSDHDSAAAGASVSGVCESRFGSPIEKYVFEDMWAGPPDPKGVFDVEDSACGLIRFEGGPSLELNVTWAANIPDGLYRDGILLLGDRGGCFFDLWGDQFIVTRERGGRVIDERPRHDNAEAWNRAWDGQHEAFRRSVTERTPPRASGACGRRVQALIEAMYESSRTGRDVAVRFV